MSNFFNKKVFFAVFVLFAATAPFTALAVFNPSQLEYLGSFRVPSGSTTETTFDYGGTAISYNPANNSIFLAGHDWHQLLAELSIPQLVKSSNMSNLQTASIIQQLTDPLEGKMNLIDSDIGSGESGKIGGTLVCNNKLIVSAYTYYDGNGNATASHFLRSLNLSTPSVQGPYKIGNSKVGATAGYMALVPQGLQSALGGDMVTGQCCISIISRSSFGAALNSLNFSNLNNSQNPVPATTLVDYPLNNQPWNFTASFNSSSNLFNAVTAIKGVFIDESSDSVIFIGRQGLGETCYKNNLPNCNNGGGYGTVGIIGNDGQRIYDVTGLWAYKISDLVQAKNGTLQPWNVTPAAWYQFDLPISDAPYVGGVAFDSANNRLLVSQYGANNAATGGGAYSNGPVINVYKLNSVSGGSSDNVPPSIPTGLNATAVSSSQINLLWAASSDNVSVAGYKIYRNGTWINTISNLSYSDANLSPSTTYNYSVAAFDLAGNVSSLSSPATATTSGNSQPSSGGIAPSAPSNLVSGSITLSSIGLSWSDNSNNETGFRITATPSAGGSSIELNVASSATSTTLTGLAAGTSYGVKVEAYNSAGYSSPSNTIAITTLSADAIPSSTSPSAFTVSSISVKNIAPTSAVVSWTTSALSDSLVEYGATTNYSNATTLNTTPVSNHEIILSNLLPNTTYHFRVISKNSSGSTTASSDYSFTTTNWPVVLPQITISPSTSAPNVYGTFDVYPPNTRAAAVIAAVNDTREGEKYEFREELGVSFSRWVSPGDVKVSLSCDDGKSISSSGCIQTAYCVDNKNECVPSTAYNEKDKIVISNTGNKEDTYYVRYYSRDNKGNTEKTQSRTVIIDKGLASPSGLLSASSSASASSSPAPSGTELSQISQTFKILDIPQNFRFDKDMRVGARSPDVYYLQQILNADVNTKVSESGAGSPGRETLRLGALTSSAVKRFQEKYKGEILEPLGLKSSTGVVGFRTRMKLNEILEELRQ